MADLLDKIVDQYLDSGDFNGYFFHEEPEEVRHTAVGLLDDGLIEVVSEADYPNPHIRPWPTRRPVEQQRDDIDNSGTEHGAICLYPTAKALEGRLDAQLHHDEPYRRRLAEGRGTLELAYFRFDVLESYRNDPRFHFDFDDFGVRISVSDEVYLDEDEDPDDKTSIYHVGFAYNETTIKRDSSEPITRYICVFLGDLSKLTPGHQQRWRTYEVTARPEVRPHPVWMAAQMGHWPDGLGPFARLFFELEAWNELHTQAFGVPLLKTVDRPREFGWVLRPSQHEYDSFIHQLDKLLSENLQHKAFDAADVPRKDENDQPIGSLNRLDRLLAKHNIPEADRRGVLKPLRDVRTARQKPAHTLRSNVTDRNFIRDQAELMALVVESLMLLRSFWQNHPRNAGWQEPDYVADDRYYWL
ncbi:hypothetical protein ACIBCP_27150 [Streptomyces sp. NPDC051287]|uniref:hypothetical protein n=1 Tax=Streptomyces sp. NPDC051287 TaxID=3365648 RepID=UPI0037B34611